MIMVPVSIAEMLLGKPGASLRRVNCFLKRPYFLTKGRGFLAKMHMSAFLRIYKYRFYYKEFHHFFVSRNSSRIYWISKQVVMDMDFQIYHLSILQLFQPIQYVQIAGEVVFQLYLLLSQRQQISSNKNVYHILGVSPSILTAQSESGIQLNKFLRR